MNAWLRLSALLFACLFALPAAAAGKRVALVVGISAYPGGDRLEAPVHDARAIGRQLRGIGFEVTESIDAGYRRLREDLDDFTALAQGAEVALFYYAGHGFEVGGENFLLPVDVGQPMASIDRATVRMRGLPLSAVLRDISAAAPRATVAVIDACRDAPTRGGAGRGLAIPPVGDGVFVAYSTRPGERAIDSAASLGHDKRNSPFALFFAENLLQPGLGLLDLMAATQSQVDSFTKGRQRPWFSSALNGPVVLHAAPAPGRGTAAAGKAGRGAAPAACPPVRTEASRLWNEQGRAVEEGVYRLDGERLSQLRARAETGDALALTTLGLAYDRGTAVRQDRGQARRLWTQAAESGHAVAQTLLGEAIFEDDGAAGRREARAWLQRASNAGAARATMDLLAFDDDPRAMAERMMLAFCQGTQGFQGLLPQ